MTELKPGLSAEQHRLATESQLIPKGPFDCRTQGTRRSNFSAKRAGALSPIAAKVEKLRQRLKRERKEAQIVLYPGGDHGFIILLNFKLRYKCL